MRRAAVAVIVTGCTFGGIGPVVGHQPGVIGASLTAMVQPVKNASAKKAAADKSRDKKTKVRRTTKTIDYRGYQVSVPASWPVYNLNKDPEQCVRYDVNAVYIGTPGKNQDCPPNLIGRADTISIGGPAAPGGSATTDGVRAGDRKTGATTPRAGTIERDTQQHEFSVAMPSGAPPVQATYGRQPGVVERSLATVRRMTRRTTAAKGDVTTATTDAKIIEATKPASKSKPASKPATKPSTAPTSGPQVWPSNPSWVPPIPGSPTPTATPTTTTTPSPSPKPTPTPTPTPTQSSPVLTDNPGGPDGAQAGFDTCTAPSLQAMKAWKAKYSATAIYIGGQMMACDYGNLSASWVKQAEAMGWSLVPTYVGLQAPCDSFSGSINAKQAASQGTTAANQAVQNAESFGLAAGTPIYYDMEGYNHTNASCRTAVLTFLDAWDRQLEADHYVSGVYSSADSAAIDLQSTTTIAGHALAEPQNIWFALWDNANTLTGAPYMSSSVWATANRSKQYAGNQVVKIGGYSLDIDSDWVNSAVARGDAASPIRTG